jgi:hypothetical protein
MVHIEQKEGPRQKGLELFLSRPIQAFCHAMPKLAKKPTDKSSPDER